MKKETIFYSIIAISILIFSLSFAFSQYIDYHQSILAEQDYQFKINKATYDCMAQYYPGIMPDEKSITVALKKGSCKQMFSK